MKSQNNVVYKITLQLLKTLQQHKPPSSLDSKRSKSHRRRYPSFSEYPGKIIFRDRQSIDTYARRIDVLHVVNGGVLSVTIRGNQSSKVISETELLVFPFALILLGKA